MGMVLPSSAQKTVCCQVNPPPANPQGIAPRSSAMGSIPMIKVTQCGGIPVKNSAIVSVKLSYSPFVINCK